MSSLPLVTVVIPVKDDQAGLVDTLAALVLQDFPAESFCVLVVDNGSAVPVRLPQGLPFSVTLLQCSTPGSYAARNVALARVESEFVAFTDADCAPEPGWLTAGVAALRSDPGVGLVAGQIDTPLPTHREPSSCELYQHFHAFPQQRYAEQARFGATANVFTRASVLAQVGLFDAARASGGDREWGNRVHAAGWGVVFCAAARVLHPPRGSWASWWRKLVRVHEGQLMELSRRGVSAREMLPKGPGAVVPPVLTVRRVLAEHGGRLSVHSQVRYAAGATLARWAGSAAKVRVGVPAWRRQAAGPQYVSRGTVTGVPRVSSGGEKK